MPLQFSNVWCVLVYCEDDRTEIYYHTSRKDVLTSIDTTWSKKPDSINIRTDNDKEIQVWQDSDGKLLLRSFQMTDREVLTGPTHY